MTVQAEADVGVQLLATFGELTAQVQTLNRHHEREARRRAELNAKIMPLDVDLQPIPLSAGAGVLDQPRLLGPPMGWTWQLDGLGAQGFTAGSVAVFINGVGGTQLLTFTAAGVFYQRHFRFLRYGQRLIFQASGITGTAAIWVAGLAFADEIQGEALL